MDQLQGIMRFCNADRRYSGRSRNPKGKGNKRTAEYDLNGFLNHRFEIIRPYYPAISNSRVTQRDFRQSLGYLSSLYDFTPEFIVDDNFPLNISIAYEDAIQKLKKKRPELCLIITTNAEGKICLATEQKFTTGNYLYYIPVGKVFRMLRKREDTQLARLFISSFSYLYQIVGIPYFRDNSTYLSYQYQSTWESLCDESFDDRYEVENFNKQFHEVSKYGDRLKTLITDTKHLELFKSRLEKYKPQTAKQSEIIEIIAGLFQLFQEFPNKSVLSSLEVLVNKEDSDEDRMISFDQYCSFIYDIEGSLYEYISELINYDFESCASLQEPLSFQVFDKRQIKAVHDHSFEARLFLLMDNLCYCLNKLI